MIGDGLLNSTLQCDYRYRPGEFRMMATAYVDDITKENVGYIYEQLYRQCWPLYYEECILS